MRDERFKGADKEQRLRSIAIHGEILFRPEVKKVRTDATSGDLVIETQLMLKGVEDAVKERKSR